MIDKSGIELLKNGWEGLWGKNTPKSNEEIVAMNGIYENEWEYCGMAHIV